MGGGKIRRRSRSRVTGAGNLFISLSVGHAEDKNKFKTILLVCLVTHEYVLQDK